MKILKMEGGGVHSFYSVQNKINPFICNNCNPKVWGSEMQLCWAWSKLSKLLKWNNTEWSYEELQRVLCVLTLVITLEYNYWYPWMHLKAYAIKYDNTSLTLRRDTGEYKITANTFAILEENSPGLVADVSSFSSWTLAWTDPGSECNGTATNWGFGSLCIFGGSLVPNSRSVCFLAGCRSVSGSVCMEADSGLSSGPVSISSVCSAAGHLQLEQM